jgi:hypothetical protein
MKWRMMADFNFTLLVSLDPPSLFRQLSASETLRSASVSYVEGFELACYEMIVQLAPCTNPRWLLEKGKLFQRSFLLDNLLISNGIYNDDSMNFQQKQLKVWCPLTSQRVPGNCILSGTCFDELWNEIRRAGVS